MTSRDLADFEEPKERAITNVVLSAGIAAIVLLYVAMFAAVYLWSRYAPLLPPDGTAEPAIFETMPWV
jgi:hypothetical protein